MMPFLGDKLPIWHQQVNTFPTPSEIHLSRHRYTIFDRQLGEQPETRL